jgi:peptidoglycan hydrolase CwlO-like protein
MPRGRRRAPADVNSLEDELKQLKQRQAELRVQLRKLRNSSGEIRKLEEKLAKQLATAKWTVGEIRQIQPEWDEMGFYSSVAAKKPTPRGRRPRSAAAAAE